MMIDETRGVKGHAIVHNDQWRCVCGQPLGHTRKVAREIMKRHRAELLFGSLIQGTDNEERLTGVVQS